MKINFTLFGAKLTGGSFNLVEVAQRLAKRGHKISLTTIGNPRDLDWFRKSQKPLFQENFTPLAGNFLYRVYRKLLKGTILHPFPGVEIKDLIRSIPDCDINIATSAPTTFAVYRSGKGKGFYYIQHFDSFFVKDPLVNKIHNESYFLPLEKITVSTWLKNAIKNELNVDVKSVITAGIDDKIFYPREKQKAANRKKRIISLGRRVEWKGFEDLRKAMIGIFKKRKDIEWIVYSSRDIPKLTSEAPFALVKSPYGKELARLYSNCDILVNPSWHEGFAQPALEAMACGCAVITTSIGAEDFAKDNENCLIIEPKNPVKIQEAIAKLLDDKDLTNRLINNGLKTAKEFSWNRIIDKWENVFNKL